MELTGNCKKAFGEWYLSDKSPQTMTGEEYLNIWYLTRTDSEKYGVFEDFFATHDIYFQRWATFYKNGINQEWQILVYDNTEEYLHGKESTAQYGDNHEYPTPMEARLAVIKKANKIYNGKEI